MDYTVHEILQARILEWVAFPFSRGSSQPRNRTQISHIAGGFFTSHKGSPSRINIPNSHLNTIKYLFWQKTKDRELWKKSEEKKIVIKKHKNYRKLLSRMGFPDSSAGKESACNSGDPGSISGSGRSTGEGIRCPLQYSWASLVTQLVKNLPAMWETWILYYKVINLN